MAIYAKREREGVEIMAVLGEETQKEARTLSEATRQLVERMEEIRDRERKTSMEKPQGQNQTGPNVDATRNPLGKNVAERLAKKFGFGTNPDRRQKFYEALEAEVIRHGDPVYMIIADCVTGSERAMKPARWFCKSVLARLREKGFLHNDDTETW